VTAVTLTLLVLGTGPASPENVNRFTAATIDGTSIPFNTNIARILDEGPHTLRVTGAAIVAGDLVAVNLLDGASGAPLGTVFGFPAQSGAFTLSLPFQCANGRLVGPNGVAAAGGTIEHPARLVVRDGSNVLPFADNTWSIICRRDGLEFTVVPMLVRVLRGAAFTDFGEIRALVQVASNTLRERANILLTQPRDNITIKLDQFDTGNKDGSVQDPPELTQLLAVSAAELRRLFGSGRGLAAVIANAIVGGPCNGGAGCAGHDSARPVVFLVPTLQATPALRGNDLAHEFCHTFSLGRFHTIEGGSPFEPKADATWHHPSDPQNLMFPFNPTAAGTPRGSELTLPQVRQCRTGGRSRGMSKTRVGDPVLVRMDTKHGSWDDPSGDVTSGHVDLVGGTLFAQGELDNLDVLIELGAAHPSGTNVAEQFEMFFDTDDDVATGATFGTFAGIDKVLTIALTGQFPFTAPAGTMATTLLDVASGTVTTLEPGRVDRLQIHRDGPAGPMVADSGDAIRQSFSLPFLGALADQVPIGVRATSLDTGEVDETAFVFDFRPPAGPQLEMTPLVGRPGDRVNLQGANFPPSSRVKILVNHGEVLEATAGADGSLSASFRFPAGLALGDHFVTAAHETGAFDFSVFKVTPVARFSGKAHGVGLGDSGGLRIVARYVPDTDLDLGASQVTLTRLLAELDGGAGELVHGLPIVLLPAPGSNATSAVYETPVGALPRARLVLGKRGTAVNFRLDISGARIAAPRLCAGAPRRTTLTTSFTVTPQVSIPGLPGVSITTEQPWGCSGIGDRYLKAPP
jgi:hypothetical protein